MHTMLTARRWGFRLTLICISMSISLVLLLLHGSCTGLQPQRNIFTKPEINGPIVESIFDGDHITTVESSRRNFVHRLLRTTTTFTVANSLPSISSASIVAKNDKVRHPFAYSNTWTGTNLKILSLEDATKNDAYEKENSGLYWKMGKWPDPALRIPAKPVDSRFFSEGSSVGQQEMLKLAANILRDTARREGAVGLAAQQCGVDAKMVYLSASRGVFGNDEMVLVNPRIVARSPESSMKVWTEECLVLPPTFRATVLRDDWIDVEYDFSYEYRSREQKLVTSTELASSSLQTPIRRRFVKEQSRCLQHELDHDRGILITDHVGLDELENPLMQQIETDGHERRQALAYSRQITL